MTQTPKAAAGISSGTGNLSCRSTSSIRSLRPAPLHARAVRRSFFSCDRLKSCDQRRHSRRQAISIERAIDHQRLYPRRIFLRLHAQLPAPTLAESPKTVTSSTWPGSQASTISHPASRQARTAEASSCASSLFFTDTLSKPSNGRTAAIDSCAASSKNSITPLISRRDASISRACPR